MAKPTFLMTHLGLFLIIIVALVIGEYREMESFVGENTQAPLPKDLIKKIYNISDPSNNYKQALQKTKSFRARDQNAYYAEILSVTDYKKSGLKDSSYLQKSNPVFQAYVTRVNTLYDIIDTGKYSQGDATVKSTLLTEIQKLKNKLDKYP